MTPEQLDELVNLFLLLPFESAKKLERAKESASVPWHVFVAYKDKFISITIEDVFFFEFLTNRMGKYINIKQWFCAENKQDDVILMYLKYRKTYRVLKTTWNTDTHFKLSITGAKDDSSN